MVIGGDIVKDVDEYGMYLFVIYDEVKVVGYDFGWGVVIDVEEVSGSWRFWEIFIGVCNVVKGVYD